MRPEQYRLKRLMPLVDQSSLAPAELQFGSDGHWSNVDKYLRLLLNIWSGQVAGKDQFSVLQN